MEEDPAPQVGHFGVCAGTSSGHVCTRVLPLAWCRRVQPVAYLQDRNAIPTMLMHRVAAGRRLLADPANQVQATFILNTTNAQLPLLAQRLGSITLPGDFSQQLGNQGKLSC